MKYYKLSKDGEDKNVILACEDENKVRLAFEKYGKEYTLTECEAPKDAAFVNEEPTLGRATPYMMNNYNELEVMLGGYTNLRNVVWEGQCCSRCKNRYNAKSDFCFKHHNDANCYRFKLEL